MIKTKLTRKYRNTPRKKKIILAIILAIAVGLALYFIFIYKPTITTTPSTTEDEDKALVEKGVSPKNANAQQSGQNNKQGQTASREGQNIITPQGNFVSNHTVTSLTDTIESICNTNSGASCEITFKQGGTVKSLGKKNTDTNGTATWLWTPDSIGLSGGNWEIVAISTYNGNAAQQADPRPLEIKL